MSDVAQQQPQLPTSKTACCCCDCFGPEMLLMTRYFEFCTWSELDQGKAEKRAQDEWTHEMLID